MEIAVYSSRQVQIRTSLLIAGSAICIDMKTFDDDARAKLKAWLQKIMDRERLTATEVARKAGLTSTTLTRFMNKDEPTLLSSRTIAKIEATFAFPLLDIKGGNHTSGMREEARPYAADGEKPKTPVDRAIDALINDQRGCDAWVLETDALAALGYLAGDVVIVDLNAKAESGDIVCAQAYDWDTGTAETIFRLFEAPYLTAPSTHPRHRKPRLVDNDTVSIKGVVIASLRPARTPREPD